MVSTDLTVYLQHTTGDFLYGPAYHRFGEYNRGLTIWTTRNEGNPFYDISCISGSTFANILARYTALQIIGVCTGVIDQLVKLIYTLTNWPVVY